MVHGVISDCMICVGQIMLYGATQSHREGALDVERGVAQPINGAPMGLFGVVMSHLVN